MILLEWYANQYWCLNFIYYCLKWKQKQTFKSIWPFYFFLCNKMSSTEDENEIYRMLFNYMKGIYIAAQRFKLNLNKSTSVVTIVDKSAKNKWLARIDGPHNNVNFPHVNINPRIQGCLTLTQRFHQQH